jgi:Rieske Fe-S protein
MNRRDFLRQTLRTPADTSESARLFPLVARAGSPRQYRAGTRVLVEEARAWLCRDALGFYAVDAHCPHLGCLVRRSDDGRFVCPGHGSHFNADGQREAGPAAHELRYLYVDLDEAGNLVIRRERSADPNDRLIA